MSNANFSIDLVNSDTVNTISEMEGETMNRAWYVTEEHYDGRDVYTTREKSGPYTEAEKEILEKALIAGGYEKDEETDYHIVYSIDLPEPEFDHHGAHRHYVNIWCQEPIEKTPISSITEELVTEEKWLADDEE